MTHHYLKPNVKMEPLMWRWYAWPYLIPPMTAACNLAERYLPIMSSFVKYPAIHRQAVTNPAMMGGPFIDLPESAVPQVQALLDSTRDEAATLLQLHQAYKDFDRLLQRQAQGQTLEPLYDQVPEALRGLVELGYDLHHHAQMQLIEPFFYQRYYDDQAQGISLSLMDTDERAFVMSTPRVSFEGEMYLPIPFSHPGIDILFQARQHPVHLDDLMASLGVTQRQAFLDLFTTTPPQIPQDRHHEGSGVRVRYFGHACVLLQTQTVSLLIDPLLGYDLGQATHFTQRDLPERIDYVLLTHNHQDHVMLETLLQLRHRIGQVVVPSPHTGSLADPSLPLILRQLGFNHVKAMEPLETLDIPDGYITTTPFLGEHADLTIGSKTAHAITLQNRCFLMAADSNNIAPEMYHQLKQWLGRSIDVLFIGMECDGAPLSWLYGPLLTEPLNRGDDDSRTLSGSNCDKAWAAVQALGCQEVYVYAMGMEPWLGHIMALSYTPESVQLLESDKLVARCQEQGIQAERLYLKREWLWS